MEGCGLEVKTFLVMHDTLEALLQSSHRHDRNTVRLESPMQQHRPFVGLAQCYGWLSIPRGEVAKNNSVLTPVAQHAVCARWRLFFSSIANVVIQSCEKRASEPTLVIGFEVHGSASSQGIGRQKECSRTLQHSRYASCRSVAFSSVGANVHRWNVVGRPGIDQPCTFASRYTNDP
jgi:hypothetical protein